MSQIKDISEAVGKTVTLIKMDNCDRSIGIRFTDGSYVYIYVGSGYDGDVEFSECATPDTCFLRDLGVISEEEAAQIHQKEIEEREVLERQRDLLQYERLKAKLGK